MTVELNPDTLATFMGDANIDSDRADLVLQLVVDACSIYITPVPAQALGVVLTASARLYSNPQQLAGSTEGPFSTQHASAYSTMLTSSERRFLMTLSGQGGAFTIDPTPSDAGTQISSWDENIDFLNGVLPFQDTVDE